MKPEYIIWILTAIILAEFIFETVLDILNLNYSTTDLPEELQNIYDRDKYEKSVKYKKEATRFGLIKSTVMTVGTIFMFLLGGFAYLHDLATKITQGEVAVSMVFFGLIYLLMFIIELPFSYYSTFVIEEKYGFNKTTFATFVTDKIKSLILTAIIGGLILWVILELYIAFGKNFWWYAWITVTLFSLFMITFYSDLIVPLFNKQVPLEDGELKDKIFELARKTGFNLDKIYKIDGSKRSTKANAYFAGLVSRKRIILYDTLIETMSVEEILAVLAHEIGHYKHKHIVKGFIFSTLNTGLILFLFSIISESKLFTEALLHSPFGYNSNDAVAHAYFHLNIIVFSVLYSPVSTITGIIMNVFSRKNEYQADNFAKEQGLAANLISALKKLAKNNLSNLTPHPLYVKVYYSHPDLYSRIKNLKN